MPRTTESPTCEARRFVLRRLFGFWRCAVRWLVAVTVRWSMANARRRDTARVWGWCGDGGRERPGRQRVSIRIGLRRRIATSSVRLHFRDAFVTRAQQSRTPADRQEGKGLRKGHSDAASGEAWLHVARAPPFSLTDPLSLRGPWPPPGWRHAPGRAFPCRDDATGVAAPPRLVPDRCCFRQDGAGGNEAARPRPI